jgi:threonyl-tRNA synthetase
MHSVLEALRLIEHRGEYFKRGYQEVQSPNMYDHKLWMTSGHWQHYKDDMFSLAVEKREFALKPMNW